MTKVVIGLAVLVALAALGAAAAIGPFLLRVDTFGPDPEHGARAPFHLYASRSAARAARQGRPVVLLVQPNNSGRISDDPQFHHRDAWWTAFGRHRLAERLGVVLLVPAFLRPADDWQVYTHALDRDALTTGRPDLRRPDLQLIAMIDRARGHLQNSGIELEDRILLQGYSASGMFANRFAALHPERVLAVAVGSPGGWPIAPVGELEGQALAYPAGIADLDELTGRPFDLEAWRRIPQLLVMGSEDDNDSLDFGDGWEREHAALVDRLFGTTPLSRWDGARALYASVGADAEFRLVQGVGHDRRALQEHSTSFFERILGEARQRDESRSPMPLSRSPRE